MINVIKIYKNPFFIYTIIKKDQNIKTIESEIRKINKELNKLIVKNPEIIKCRCGNQISSLYVLIIEKLREENLLPSDFEPLCCSCKTMNDALKCVGVKYSIYY